MDHPYRGICSELGKKTKTGTYKKAQIRSYKANPKLQKCLHFLSSQYTERSRQIVILYLVRADNIERKKSLIRTLVLW